MHVNPPLSRRCYIPLLSFFFAVQLCFSPQILPDDARLPSPAFEKAISVWAGGRAGDALAVLDAQLSGLEQAVWPPEAHVLRAWLLSECGRCEEAEEHWLAVAERTRPLRVFSYRRIFNCRMTRGDTAGTQEILEKLISMDGVRAHADLALALASCFRRAGKLDEAESLYRRILRVQHKGGYADAARLGLAAVLESEEKTGDAIVTLRQAQLDHYRASTLKDARAAEKRLCAAAGKKVARFGERDYSSFAVSLRKASFFKNALEVLEEWRAQYPASHESDRIEWHFIENLYLMRANDESLARCAQFLENFPRSSLSHQIRFTQLRLYVRLGQTAKVKSSAEVILETPGVSSSIKENTGLVLASYLVSIGEVEAGLDAYRRAYRSAASSEQKRSILWRAGVAALRVGQNQRAVTNLRALVGLNPPRDLEPSALYWLGVAESRMGQWEAALTALLKLEGKYSYDYYGVRARLFIPSLQDKVTGKRFEALCAAAGQKSLDFTELKIQEKARHHDLFKAAEILARAGLTGEAAALLEKLLVSFRADKGLAYCAARTYTECGDFKSALGILATYFPSYLKRPATGLPEDFWELAFPRPYWNEIRRAAEAHSVDPFLMLALMRQESRFDPAARSAVGAIGLFQIMPYTADQIGPGLGLKKVSEQDLTDPYINSLIAAKLLSGLIRQYDSFYVPAIAAYNAGEGRVDAWWKAGKKLSDDLFIDSMPYMETRVFVRTVLNNYFTYSRLYQPRVSADD
jgi:soluble lytic murein transglycosylase-like protein